MRSQNHFREPNRHFTLQIKYLAPLEMLLGEQGTRPRYEPKWRVLNLCKSAFCAKSRDHTIDGWTMKKSWEIGMKKTECDEELYIPAVAPNAVYKSEFSSHNSARVAIISVRFLCQCFMFSFPWYLVGWWLYNVNLLPTYALCRFNSLESGIPKISNPWLCLMLTIILGTWEHPTPVVLPYSIIVKKGSMYLNGAR
jgi:hypothetical protein